MNYVDAVTAEIIRLEKEPVFNPAAWEKVLNTLRQQGRTAGYEDAWRRMCRAMDNATSFMPDPVLEAEEVCH